MNIRSKYLVVAGAAALVVAGGGIALAQAQGYVGDDADEVAAVQRASISLAQAVTAAERGSGGRAIEASIESNWNTAAYEVTVFAENQLKEVHVDPQSGRVLNIRVDRD